MAFYSIPGNIKQRFLPFVINPSAFAANKMGMDSEQFKTEKILPQLFTYRQLEEYSAGGTAGLGFFPNTVSQAFKTLGSRNLELNKDISMKLLYGPTKEYDSTDALKLEDIISSIPGVSIREFLPDTRLDQCLNIFKEIFSKFSEIFMKAKDLAKGMDDANKFKQLGRIIWNCAEFTLNYMVGNGEFSFIDDVFPEGIDVDERTLKFTDTSSDAKSIQKYVHDFPFIMYYRLQQCATTNIYEVPAMCEGKPIMSSDGKSGWGDDSDFMGSGGFRIEKIFNMLPGAFGKIANMVLGNIGINYTPWWNAESGAKASAAPEINITFDLFNDNVDKALFNFIFVNTIVPSNRWIQYNMFQHSSNLYDVKIEGLNRLFACSGAFDVSYEGVLRDPPEHFLTLLKGHINESYDAGDFITNARKNKLIKIPDVYRVKMSFKSLLPNNFNNFLYTYSQNVNHMVTYTSPASDGATQKDGKSYEEMFMKGVDTYAKRLETMISSSETGNNDEFGDQMAELEGANANS